MSSADLYNPLAKSSTRKRRHIKVLPAENNAKSKDFPDQSWQKGKAKRTWQEIFLSSTHNIPYQSSCNAWQMLRHWESLKTKQGTLPKVLPDSFHQQEKRSAATTDEGGGAEDAWEFSMQE